jgi:hypothetical protein
MTLYVLIRELSYEPGDTLGVYSTQEKAEAAMGRNAQRSGWADGLRIVEFELDDEPHKMTPAEDAT